MKAIYKRQGLHICTELSHNLGLHKSNNNQVRLSRTYHKCVLIVEDKF